MPLTSKVLLRFHVCGGAATGKRALVDRLLAGGGLTTERQPQSTPEGGGLVFSSPRRSFRVAGVPGRERYTRDLVAGASTADLSVILVDARQGIATRTRLDSLLVSLLGIRQVVLAVNKMDLIGHARATFERIEAATQALAGELGLPAIACVPISALQGDNIFERSAAMSWYAGPTLIDRLDEAEVDDTGRLQPLRLPVDRVERSSGELRRYAGTIVAGHLRPGDPIRVQPAGRLGRVARIVGAEGELGEATLGQSIAITLDGEIDVSPGDLIVPANQPAEVSDQFEATVVWMSPSALLPGRNYLLQIGSKTVTATVAPLKYKINPNNLQHLAAAKLDLDEVGVCNLQLDRPVPFDPHRVNRHTGGFLLLDRQSGDTVGAGMLHFALRRAQNVHWQAVDVNKAARSTLKGQRACVIWYTGLSGAGKSTIANLVDKKLHSLNRHTYLLDGDNVRHGLNKDLGFTDVDRVENIRRIAEVARLMVDAGLIVSTAFISPFRAERQMARTLVAEGEFIEIYVATPIEVAEKRDPKGLYKKARRGDLKNFTGIDSPYEAPERPDLTVDTTVASAEDAAAMIVAYLRERGTFR
jgi:bifunctional enzyme CysN/CysC